MNLIKEYLGSLGSNNLFPIISMIIFILFFMVMMIYTLRIKKEDITEYSNMPLDDEKDTES
jgi:cytochrome c oxidase cbb3-type subunit IV